MSRSQTMLLMKAPSPSVEPRPRTPRNLSVVTSAQESGPPLRDELDYLIRVLRRRQVSFIDQRLAKLDLPLSAWYPLIVLKLGDGISQRDLSKRLSLKDAAVGKAIDSLERSGLLQREADATDRRKFLVVLTPKGHKAADRITALRAELLEHMQAGFTEKESALFKQFLQRAYANLDGRSDGTTEDPTYSSLQYKRKRPLK